MTFAECIPYLLQEKNVKRSIWRYNDYLFIGHHSEHRGDRYLICSIPADQLSRTDLEADDWEVMG